MGSKKSKENYKEVLNKRIISEKFAYLTAPFDLNISFYIIPPKGFMPAGKDEPYGYIQKLHKVFDLSGDFKTELWCDGLLAERAELHAVSKNGYLYINYDGFWDVEYMYSSELTRDFIQDICNAFGKYYGYKMSCELEKYIGEIVSLVISPSEKL